MYFNNFEYKDLNYFYHLPYIRPPKKEPIKYIDVTRNYLVSYFTVFRPLVPVISISIHMHESFSKRMRNVSELKLSEHTLCIPFKKVIVFFGIARSGYEKH